MKSLRRWKVLMSIYGQRWADSYDGEPSEPWAIALDAATEAEFKRAVKSLMSSGDAHPPSLPQFVELLRPGTAERAKSKHPEPNTPDWNAARAALMQGIAKQSRDRGVQFTDADRAQSAAALAHVDNPPGTHGFDEARRADARAAAERMARHVGMTPEQLLAKWDREAADHRSERPAA